MNETSYTFRDKIKTACVSHCLERGIDTEAMLELFLRRTAELKTAAASKQAKSASSQTKTALFGLTAAGTAKGLLGTAAASAVPLALVGGGSAIVGNVLGKQLGDMLHGGDLPSKAELSNLDLAVTYEREAEEIKRRMALNKRCEKEQGKPSVRKLF